MLVKLMKKKYEEREKSHEKLKRQQKQDKKVVDLEQQKILKRFEEREVTEAEEILFRCEVNHQKDTAAINARIDLIEAKF